MTARAEQETTLTAMRDDVVAYVHTSNTSDLGKLRVLAATTDFVVEVRGGADWGEFTVKSENFKPLLAIRGRRVRSAAQIAASQASGARLAAARASHGSSSTVEGLSIG